MTRRVTLSCLALCAIALALSACNTTKGVGKDVKAAGQGVENAADRHGAE